LEVWAVSAVLVVQVVPVVWAVLAGQAVQVAWVARAVWVVLAVQVVLVVQVVGGNTTRSIVVALPMEIVERRTDLVVRLGETRWPIVKPARGSRLTDRAAMYVLEAAGWVLHPEDLAEAIDPEGDLAEAIEEEDLAEAAQIAREAGIFRAAAAETGMPSVGAPEGTADRAPAPTAAEVPPAWDLEVVAGLAAAAVAAVAVAAAGDGGGRHGRRT
jgi:hypothetical protein